LQISAAVLYFVTTSDCVGVLCEAGRCRVDRRVSARIGPERDRGTRVRDVKSGGRGDCFLELLLLTVRRFSRSTSPPSPESLMVAAW